MLLEYIVLENYNQTIQLAETIVTDKVVNDPFDNMESVITTHYQSLYLHLKALSKYFLIRNDLNRSRRLINLANQLADVLNQSTEVRFRKT